MKKLLTFFAIVAVGVTMVSCGSAESKKRKAYQRETESVLSDISTKAQIGWKYIQKNLTDDEELWLVNYHEWDETICRDPKNPLSKYNFDGLTVGLYYVVDIYDEENILAVCFKYGEPRLLCDINTFTDFTKIVILLLDAWDDRTDTEKILEKAGKRLWEKSQLRQSIRNLQ